MLNTVYDAAGHPDCTTTGPDCSSGLVTDYGTDASGRITSVQGPDQDFDYAWDPWDRLESATGPSASLAFGYDALDRTVSRDDGSTITSFVYTGLSEDPARISDGSVTTDYAYANGLPLAQKTGTDVRYLVRDLHSDVVGLAALDGTVAGTAAFGPWGEPRDRTGEESRLGYQGDLTDPHTGLVDMLTRLYDPALGRFISRDVLFGEPERPLSLNQFAYGNGNPVTYSDPLGLCPAGEGSQMVCTHPAPPMQDPKPKGDADPLPQIATDPPGEIAYHATAMGAAQTAYHLSSQKAYEQAVALAELAMARIERSFCCSIWDELFGNPVSSWQSGWEQLPPELKAAGFTMVLVGGLFLLCFEQACGFVGEPGELPIESETSADIGEAEYGSTPEGRPFTRHYGVETGPERNIPGSVVDEAAIDSYPGKAIEGGKTVHYDPNNDITVVTGDGESIVSVHHGPPRAGQQ